MQHATNRITISFVLIYPALFRLIPWFPTFCVLRGRQHRVQNSVFECVVDATQAHELKFKLKELIDTEKDSLRFYNLGDKYTNRIEHYGAKSAIKVEEPLIF